MMLCDATFRIAGGLITGGQAFDMGLAAGESSEMQCGPLPQNGFLLLHKGFDDNPV